MSEAEGPSSLRRVFSATLHYGLASYLPRVINFLLIPIYMVYLSPAQLGIVEICIAVEVLMQAVSRLGLPGALARTYFDHREGESFRDLVATTSAAVLVASVVTALIALAIGPFIFASFLPSIPFFPYIGLALLASVLQCGGELQSRLLQAKEHSALAARINVVVSVFATLTQLLMVAGLHLEAMGVVLADVATGALAMAIAVYRHRDDLGGRIRWSLLRPSLAYGLPLVPHRLAAWMQDFAGRWVMGGLGVLAAVGQLGLAGRLVSPVNIAAGALVTAFPPAYFGWRADLSQADALRETRIVSRVAVVFAAIASLGAAFVGPLFIRFLLPTSYGPAEVVLGLLAASSLVRIIYNLAGMELLYSKRTRAISVVFIVGSAFNLATTALLVPSHGVLGAGIGQLLGTVVSVVVTVALARRTFPLPVEGRALAATLVAAAAASVAPMSIPKTEPILQVLIALGELGVVILAVLLLAGMSPAKLVRGVRELRTKRLRERRAPSTHSDAAEGRLDES